MTAGHMTDERIAELRQNAERMLALWRASGGVPRGDASEQLLEALDALEAERALVKSAAAYTDSMRERAEDEKGSADHRALVIGDLTRKLDQSERERKYAVDGWNRCRGGLVESEQKLALAEKVAQVAHNLWIAWTRGRLAANEPMWPILESALRAWDPEGDITWAPVPALQRNRERDSRRDPVATSQGNLPQIVDPRDAQIQSLTRSRDEAFGALDEEKRLGQQERIRASNAEAVIKQLRASLLATERENERLRHHQEIEGDFVCPNDLALVNLQGAIRAKREFHAEHFQLAREHGEAWRYHRDAIELLDELASPHAHNPSEVDDALLKLAEAAVHVVDVARKRAHCMYGGKKDKLQMHPASLPPSECLGCQIDDAIAAFDKLNTPPPAPGGVNLIGIVSPSDKENK